MSPPNIAPSRASTRFGTTPAGGGRFVDTYEGNLKSWVFLANAFVDLGTWDCFTPFVGAGVGGAYNTLVDFTDINPSHAPAFGFGRNPSEWNLAWALYAGVSYNVTKNFKVDLTYRYLNYGSITDTVDCIGGCNRGLVQVRQALFARHHARRCAGPAATSVRAAATRYVYAPPPRSTRRRSRSTRRRHRGLVHRRRVASKWLTHV